MTACVRTREPERTQAVMMFTPDSAIGDRHPARLIWQVVPSLDLAAFTRDAKAVEGGRGRDVTSVRMLLTLWLYAISCGIRSGREIDRLTKSEPAFRWIVGDTSVGRTTLNTFRVGHQEAFDKLFTDVLGVLLQRRLVSLDTVGQDGTRIRASASAPSFRQEASLEECREQAALHLKAVMAQPGAAQSKANEAKARQFQQRVEDAIATIHALRDNGLGGDVPRASTTDPEARVMKMPDSGFRPAYNVQFATAGDPEGGPRTIVGVRVTNIGSDMGSLTPMLADIEARTGQLPEKLLADAGHAAFADIKEVALRGVTPYVSVPERVKRSGAAGDHDPVIEAWKERMESDEGRKIARQRAALAELSNAHAKTRFAMGSILVRGLGKVTSMVLLTALTSNIMAHLGALAG